MEVSFSNSSPHLSCSWASGSVHLFCFFQLLLWKGAFSFMVPPNTDLPVCWLAVAGAPPLRSRWVLWFRPTGESHHLRLDQILPGREPCLGNWARSQQSTDLPLCGAAHRASVCSKAGWQAQEHMTSVSSGFRQHADQKEKWPKYWKSHLNFLVLGFQRSSLVWVLHRELLYAFWQNHQPVSPHSLLLQFWLVNALFTDCQSPDCCWKFHGAS